MAETTADPIRSKHPEPNKGDAQKGAGDRDGEFHERIMACEQMLGIHHPSHGEVKEPTEKERRHESRKERDEAMGKRKRH